MREFLDSVCESAVNAESVTAAEQFLADLGITDSNTLAGVSMEDLVKESSFPTGSLVTKSLLSRATLLAKEVFRAKSKAQSTGSQSSAGSTQQQVQQPDISAVSAHVSLMGSEVSAMVLANGLAPYVCQPSQDACRRLDRQSARLLGP